MASLGHHELNYLMFICRLILVPKFSTNHDQSLSWWLMGKPVIILSTWATVSLYSYKKNIWIYGNRAPNLRDGVKALRDKRSRGSFYVPSVVLIDIAVFMVGIYRQLAIMQIMMHSDCTKLSPVPMLNYHQWGPTKIVWGQFYKRYPSHQSL